MVPFLLIISFIIHLLTIFVIIILYQRIGMIEKQDSEEIDQLFQKYLAEIKDENSWLQEQLLRPNMSENNNHIIEQSEYEPFAEGEQEIKDHLETSQTANILSLTQEGYSPNEIAQKLQCGKTEVELIIKLYQENNHMA